MKVEGGHPEVLMAQGKKLFLSLLVFVTMLWCLLPDGIRHGGGGGAVIMLVA